MGLAVRSSAGRWPPLPKHAVAFAAVWDDALPPHDAAKLYDCVVWDLYAPSVLLCPPQALAFKSGCKLISGACAAAAFTVIESVFKTQRPYQSRDISLKVSTAVQVTACYLFADIKICPLRYLMCMLQIHQGIQAIVYTPSPSQIADHISVNAAIGKIIYHRWRQTSWVRCKLMQLRMQTMVLPLLGG